MVALEQLRAQRPFQIPRRRRLAAEAAPGGTGARRLGQVAFARAQARPGGSTRSRSGPGWPQQRRGCGGHPGRFWRRPSRDVRAPAWCERQLQSARKPGAAVGCATRRAPPAGGRQRFCQGHCRLRCARPLPGAPRGATGQRPRVPRRRFQAVRHEAGGLARSPVFDSTAACQVVGLAGDETTSKVGVAVTCPKAATRATSMSGTRARRRSAASKTVVARQRGLATTGVAQPPPGDACLSASGRGNAASAAQITARWGRPA